MLSLLMMSIFSNPKNKWVCWMLTLVLSRTCNFMSSRWLWRMTGQAINIKKLLHLCIQLQFHSTTPQRLNTPVCSCVRAFLSPFIESSQYFLYVHGCMAIYGGISSLTRSTSLNRNAYLYPSYYQLLPNYGCNILTISYSIDGTWLGLILNKSCVCSKNCWESIYVTVCRSMRLMFHLGPNPLQYPIHQGTWRYQVGPQLDSIIVMGGGSAMNTTEREKQPSVVVTLQNSQPFSARWKGA